MLRTLVCYTCAQRGRTCVKYEVVQYFTYPTLNSLENVPLAHFGNAVGKYIALIALQAKANIAEIHNLSVTKQA